IEAGGIQNVLESERKAVYRRADGSVAGTQTMKTGQMHDQSTNPNDKPGGPATPYVDRDNSKTGGSKGKGGPWYTDSVTLEPTDQFKDNVLLVKDKPSQTLNLKVGDAVLDEIQGHEKFVTTAAVQRGGETAPLVSEQWSIPWSMKLDKEHKGEGAEVTHTASPDQHASVTDGKLPVNEKEWWSFADEAQALAAPRHMLLQSLKISKVKDPASYGFAMSAIKKLNWSFEAQVNCASKYSWIEKDQMELSVITNKTSVTKAMSIGKGESHALSFRFLDVYDPDSFNWDRPMIFMLTGEGQVLTFHCYAPFTEVTNANSGKDSGADHYSMKIFG
ncbi:MAG TPA: hypothetical protein VFV99_27480, partial [Kofleriaceae bacterium]|nr:hypothetical protein [Kofleriaceae bacterium]